MAEYIEQEKDKFIKLSQALEVLDSCSCWWAHERMEAIPAADVRPVVRGRWIRCRENYSKCSECGTAYNHPVDWTPDKYCSECGARLFEEE